MRIDLIINNLKLTLASKLDDVLYIPMKQELKGISHSLGIRKEEYKQVMEEELNKLEEKVEKELNKRYKEVIKQWMLENWGERCPDYCEECPACKAWEYYDYLVEFDDDDDDDDDGEIVQDVEEKVVER